MFGRDLEPLAVHADVVVGWVHLGAEFGHDLAIDRHPALLDHLLRLAAGEATPACARIFCSLSSESSDMELVGLGFCPLLLSRRRVMARY